MKALFLIAPSRGHCTAAFKTAETLNLLGYESTFAVNESQQSFVRNAGFRTFELKTHPFGLDIDLKGKKATKDVLQDRMDFRIYLDRKNELVKVFKAVSPDIVFIDSFIATDFIPLYSLVKSNQTKIFFIQTMLSTSFYWLRPYYTSSISPEKRIAVLLQNLRRKINFFKNSLFDKIRFLGYDDRSTIKKMFREEKINSQYRPIWNFSSGCFFKNVTELILSPNELEYFNEKNRKIYLGSSVLNSSHKNGYLITGEKRGMQNQQIVFVSFGTLSAHKLGVIESFLNKLESILDEFPFLKIIVSAGGNSQLFINSKNKWKNFKVYLSVSQMEILSKSSFFITHGGLNSIKESISYKVPMLVYPLEGDQFGNAKKVAHKQLGICDDIYKASKSSIKENLLDLVENGENYRKRLIELNSLIEARYDSKSILATAITNFGIVH